MHVSIIEVPFDSGHPRARMGRGPDAFLAAGLVERLQRAGHSFDVRVVETSNVFPTEVGTAFALNRQIAVHVHDAAARGEFPLILTGNCISSVGGLAGLDAANLGVLWFDAHADFNTPETTTTGFLDGMALAVAGGQCWIRLAASIPNFHPVSIDRVMLVGARSFDTGERSRFEALGGVVADVGALERDGAGTLLTSLRERGERLYVHLDLDVLDPVEATANSYSEPNGPSRMQVRDLLARARQQFRIAGAAVSAYDPEKDSRGSALDAGVAFVMTLLDSSGAAGV